MDHPRERLSQIKNISVICLIFCIFSACSFSKKNDDNRLTCVQSPDKEFISDITQFIDSVELDFKYKATGQTDYVITLKDSIFEFKGLNRGEVFFTCKINNFRIDKECKDISKRMANEMSQKWECIIYRNGKALNDPISQMVMDGLLYLMLINSPILPDFNLKREFPMMGNKSYSYHLDQSWHTIEIRIGSGRSNDFLSNREIIVNQDSIISRTGNLQTSKPLSSIQKSKLNEYISNINIHSQLCYYLPSWGLEGFQIKVDEELIYSVSPEGCSIFIGNGNYNLLYYYVLSLYHELLYSEENL